MTFFCPTKNSYLQKVAREINPRVLDRAVDEALRWETNCFDRFPGLQRLASNQPCLPAPKSDYTCRDQAFGRWAIPLLQRDLHSKCPAIVASAVNTLMDLLHDPEKTIEAIDGGLVKRLADLMRHEDPVIRERVCIILVTLAQQEKGRCTICESEEVLKNVLDLLRDQTIVVRYKAAKLVKTICESWMGCYNLISFNYLEEIHELILKNRGHPHILLALLKSFKNLMAGEGKNIAFSMGALDTMIDLLSQTKENLITEVLNCLAVLMTLKHSKKEAVDKELLKQLVPFLHDYRVPVHTAAAKVLMYATHRTKAKKQAVELKGMIDRLLILAHEKLSPQTQMYALRALTNMAEYPPVREYLLKYHLERIEKLPVNLCSKLPHDEIGRYKQDFYDVVMWKPACSPEPALEKIKQARKDMEAKA